VNIIEKTEHPDDTDMVPLSRGGGGFFVANGAKQFAAMACSFPRESGKAGRFADGIGFSMGE